MRTPIKALLLSAMACLAVDAAWAEKADRSRPIQIEADSLRMDDVRKIAVYEGNVILTQGSMSIAADRIDVRQDDQGMTAGEATGRPVRFQQKMEGRDGYLEAQAYRLDYDARSEVMKLVGAAHIRQGGDDLRGGTIIYDLRTERYQAQGTSGDGKQGRVRAVIQPRSQPEGPTDGAPVKP